ncbi:hypothetical protein SMACR_06385 [Sordaria macrospora]|uniref:WGS project CABT00000000 data, contig 2.35 n=2 Tax=Sordaria macrospora TaxID=5147 RepID=F7W6M7_SORMK|nr:uncharacterized protein SMAC_06385 [Sordaria macrospora k-hell]KAA8629993.1 hypothetical protein SMACR_06385 [Sordaria macrospora]KAH7628249.1 hypothetical protein B0T09DRAFT_177595 [Sordaria sp. MPI-SDFR-AT-0083]WPJ65700.1 hypothetical protein SMAC4_06385 [Sordaria macrospora]CCC13166.1 unnamed protein product [Sordaria macrospora k-hell]
MAEVAAGALVAEQIVATGVEVGAAVAVAAPTQPLKVSLKQLARATSEDTTRALARSNHTITTIGNKVYIFGGEDIDGKLCNSDVHAILLPSKDNTGAEKLHDHYPAFPLIDAKTGETYIPAPRTKHAACAWGNSVVIHGGCDEHGNPIEEDNCLWLWDTEHMKWTKLQGQTQLGVKLAPRYGHHIFVDDKQEFLILHGGHTSTSGGSQPETETWLYSFDRNAWTTLPKSPSPPLAAVYTDNTLYTISASPDAPNLSGTINYLDLLKSTTDREKPGALVWQSITYPINPLTPGPRPRFGGALVPITTGYGRSYLIYMFGISSDAVGESNEALLEEEKYYADIWSLQLPSHGYTAAAAKDVIRDKLMPKGIESGKFSWAEAELVATEQKAELEEGKVHPGPRGLLAASGCLEGKGVVLWGGVNPKGEKEADGWVLGLAFGYADSDRFE